MPAFSRAFTRLSSGRARGVAAAGMRRVVRAVTAHPERVLGLLRAAPRRSDTGAGLDRQVQVLLALSEKLGHPDVNRLSPAEARAQLRMDAWGVSPDPAPLAELEDLVLPGPAGPLRARAYRAASGAGQPALVYFHGGGWVIGDLETHDLACRALCHRAKCTLIAIDYRLAPEHRFPAAVDDATTAFHWVREHAAELRLDPARIGVAGDSAGGTLAAVVCLRARNAGTPMPALAVLIYPGTDMTLSRPSHTTFARGFFLERASIEWYRNQYLPRREDWAHPDASPLFAENVAGLPRTLVFSAGFDPLRDEAHDYAERLEKAGVDVRRRCFDTLVHGFLPMAGASRAAAAAADAIADAVREAFAKR